MDISFIFNKDNNNQYTQVLILRDYDNIYPAIAKTCCNRWYEVRSNLAVKTSTLRSGLLIKLIYRKEKENSNRPLIIFYLIGMVVAT